MIKYFKPITVGVFMFVLIFAGFNIPSAKSQTPMAVGQLQLQIQSLLQQINALQQELARIKAAEEPFWCHDFNVNLRIGNRNANVRALQTSLQKEGLYQRDITGNFDEYTASAVVGFQDKYASEVLTPWGLARGTGFVGATTRAKLNQLYGCDIVKPPITPSVTVISPNGEERWTVGNTYEIKWSSIGLDGEASIQLEKWSSDGSSVSVSGIATVSANTGRYSWFIPRNQSTGSYYKIKISSIDGTQLGGYAPNDFSDDYFSIVSAIPPEPILSPVGGETWQQGTFQTIRWTPDAKGVNSVIISLYREGVFQKTLTGAIKDSGEWIWNIPTDQPQESLYSIRVSRISYPDFIADSNYFAIVAPLTQPSITVTSPNGGEEWEIGKTYQIQWKSQGVDKVDIRVRNVSDSPVGVLIASGIDGNLGIYSWTISSANFSSRNDYQVGISGVVGGKVIGDQSDNRFSIVAPSTQPSITVTSPKSRDIYTAGQKMTITWNSTNLNSKSGKMQLGYGSTKQYFKLIAKVPTNSNSYVWTIPNDLPGDDKNFAIKISCYDCGPNSNSYVGGYSPYYFQIIAPSTQPSITVISPNGGEKFIFGSARDITWKATNVDKVDIHLEKWIGEDGQGYAGGPLTQIIDENISASLGTYSWPVGHLKDGSIASAGDYYRIRIIKTGDTSSYSQQIADNSNNYLSIVPTTRSLTISKDAASPISSIVLGGETVDLAVFRLTASSVESLDIRRVAITTEFADNIIDTLYVYDGNTFLASGSVGSNSLTTFQIASGKLTVPAGGNKKITVKAKFKTVNHSTVLNDAAIRVRLNGSNAVEAVGVNSGATIFSGDQLAIGEMMRLFKSRPYFSLNSGSPSGNLAASSNTLLGVFDIRAASGGDITFSSASGNYLVVNITSKASDIRNTGGITLKDASGNNLDTVISYLTTGPVKFDFTDRGLTIPAGQTKQVYIYANTSNFVNKGDTIQLFLDSSDSSNISWGINGSGSYGNADMIFRGDVYANNLTNPGATTSCVRCPDLNGDGKIDSLDANLIYNHTGSYRADYDLNNDGVVSIISDIPCIVGHDGKTAEETGLCGGGGLSLQNMQRQIASISNAFASILEKIRDLLK